MKARKFYSLVLKFFILAVFYPSILCSFGRNISVKSPVMPTGYDFFYKEFGKANARFGNLYSKQYPATNLIECSVSGTPKIICVNPLIAYNSKTIPGLRSITAKFIITPGMLVDHLKLPDVINDNRLVFFDEDLTVDDNIDENTRNIKKQESPGAVLSIQEKTGIFSEINKEESHENVLPMHDAGSTDPLFTRAVSEIAGKAASKSNIKNPVGVYVKELNTGNEFGINENLTVIDEFDGNKDGYFRAASVVKLQMAYVAYRLIERGELSVDKTYYDSVTKQEFMLLPTLHKMVSQSDNNLFNTMLRLIGREKTNKTLIEYGILNSPVYGEISPAIGYSRENNIKRHGTTKVGGKITPKDMGKILEAIYNEKDENPFMECFNEALLANIYNSRIPEGIGHKYPVAHKTGTADSAGTYNDAGIIYCKNPYILVVLTKGETSSSAQKYIRELANELTSYMDERASIVR